uniref:hypothetical protein n=1 Tax=Streptomyces sp. TG1A-60 TaxID=3129111 RepID=UPI00403FED34
MARLMEGLMPVAREKRAPARRQTAMMGHPQDVIDFLLQTYGDTPEAGRTAVGTVEKVTGRPARTFAQWATEHADDFQATAGA